MGAKKAANLFQELLLCAMLWWHHLYLVFFMIYLFFTNLDNLNLPANSIASLRGEGEKVIEFISKPHKMVYRITPFNINARVTFSRKVYFVYVLDEPSILRISWHNIGVIFCSP